MLLESKRLMELAGISSGEESSVLTESKTDNLREFTNGDGVTENSSNSTEECDENDETVSEEKIRETVRAELDRMWASGEVFGKRATNSRGQVTMGFAGVGFKK